MQSLLGDEYKEFYESYNETPAKGFRANGAKPCFFDLARLADGKIPYVENGYYTEKSGLGSHPLHHAGAFYVQEPSAAFPASVLAPKRGDRVLDLCAAPGGKSSQLAEFAGEEGVLVSNEIMADRCRILLGNVERQGFRNVVVTCLSPKEMAKEARGWFDCVLVDAPCSGEGMFRKNPLAVNEWSEAGVLSCAARQKEILLYGAECVREGGTLVYSTCTFSKEENEDTVRALLDTGDFCLLPIPHENGVQAGLDPLGYTARLYPHKLRGEGHFTAAFRRVTPVETVKVKSPLRDISPSQTKVLRAFEKECLHALPQVFCYQDQLVIPPCVLPPVSKGVFRYGVKVGEVQGDRLLPHHHFFSAYGKAFRTQINLAVSDDAIARYLAGEDIDANGKGWAVVNVEGAPVGGGKISGDRLKNHYPKGLRKR